MKRLFVDKNEPVTELIARILDDPETDFLLAVPKGSVLKQSRDGFSLLAREAGAAGKTIAVESADTVLLELAAAEGLEALQPVIRPKAGGRGISDIVARESKVPSGEAPQTAPPRTRKVRVRARGQKEGEPNLTVSSPVPLAKITGENVVEEPVSQKRAPTKNSAKKNSPAALKTPAPPDALIKRIAHAKDADDGESFFRDEEPRAPRRRYIHRPKTLVLVTAVLAAFLGAAWLVTAYASRATITVRLKTAPFEYQKTVTARTSVAAADADRALIPAEVFHDSRNLTKLFPATGKSGGASKATGKITIYNAYSSSPQTLVATTRFRAPDGKVFRLVSAVTVPGAQTKNGSLVPSSVTASIAADQTGESYNVGRVDRLSIPGFQGTPRYAGFYGALLEGASGGSSGGDTPSATEKDVADAEDRVTEIVRSSLQTNLLNSYAHDFIILESASAITVGKLTANRTVDQNGNFSIFSEAQMQAIGFRETDITTLILSDQSQSSSGTSTEDFALRNPTISYSDVRPNFDRGEVQFVVSASGTIARAFDADAFKKQIAGKSVAEARSLLLAISGIKEARISLWPFWLQSVPGNEGRVTVEVR